MQLHNIRRFVYCIFAEVSSSEWSTSDEDDRNVDVTRMFNLRKRIVTHKSGTTKKFIMQEVTQGSSTFQNIMNF